MGISTFRPSFVHRAFRWSSVWQRAAEEAGLPGSSTRVLQVLLSQAARNSRGLSRHSIHRISQIPLSTVRDGVKALLQAGWIRETMGGLVIGFSPRSAAVPSHGGGGRIPPPGKEPEAKIKSMSPHPPTAPPPGAMPPKAEPEGLSREQESVVSALELAGCDRAGARFAARAKGVNLERVTRLLDDLEDLQKAGQVRNLPAAAVWALKSGPSAVKGFRRQAGRMRGEQVRKVAEPVPRVSREAFAASFAQVKRILHETTRSGWAKLTPEVRRMWAAEVRMELDRAKAQGRDSRAGYAEVLVQSKLGLRP